MKIDSISQKKIPAFWALVLLFGLIGVFIVDSYSANKPQIKTSQQAEQVLEEFNFRGEENVPLEVKELSNGAFKGEIYSYEGEVKIKTNMYLIIKTEKDETIKSEIDEKVSFYQVNEKGSTPAYLDFNDLKVGDNVEINFLKKAEEDAFKTYAVIAKRYE